jgi:hypothetical protein
VGSHLRSTVYQGTRVRLECALCGRIPRSNPIQRLSRFVIKPGTPLKIFLPCSLCGSYGDAGVGSQDFLVHLRALDADSAHRHDRGLNLCIDGHRAYLGEGSDLRSANGNSGQGGGAVAKGMPQHRIRDKNDSHADDSPTIKRCHFNSSFPVPQALGGG